MMAAWAVAAVITLAAVAGWLRHRYVVVSIVGTSMLPTFLPGDRVLVRRTAVGHIRRGQIVVVASPPGRSWIIKRAAAVPGDMVPKQSVPALSGAREHTVPDGRLVLLGDNPADSFDSRQKGYYGGATVLGVVIRKMGK